MSRSADRNPGHDANERPSAWTDLDLEAFHDGEMDDATGAALGADLRRDAALRARLSAIAEVDAAVASIVANTQATAHGSGRGTRRGPGRFGSWAAAAALTLIAGAAVVLVNSAGRRPQPPDARAASDRGSTLETDPERVERSFADHPAHFSGSAPSAEWVVLSVPVRTPRAERHVSDRSRSPSTISGSSDAPEEPNITAVLRSTTDAQRDAAYIEMGRTIRSAMAATAYLDGLDADEQVRVCRLWAEDPSLRPVVFARLAALRERDAGVRSAVDRVAADLQRRHEFLPWLRSHGLM